MTGVLLPGFLMACSPGTRPDPNPRPTQLDRVHRSGEGPAGGELTRPAAGSTQPAVAPGRMLSVIGAAGPDGRATRSAYRRLGERVGLDLKLADGKGFDAARIGQFVVRLPNGNQDAVEARTRPADGQVDYRLDQPGAAMFILSAGPSASGKTELNSIGNTQFAKLVVTVDPPKDRPWTLNGWDPGIMDKTGQTLELRPMVQPVGLPVGAMLPVKLYAFGAGMPGAVIEATGPTGEVVRETTNASGTAHFSLPSVGDWVFRHATTKGGQRYSAELAFSTRPFAPRGETR